jgi:hypothetical protein
VKRCPLCRRFHAAGAKCAAAGRPDSAPRNAYRVQIGKLNNPSEWEDALPPVAGFTAACAIFDAIHKARPRRILKGLGLGIWRVMDEKDIARLRGLQMN